MSLPHNPNTDPNSANIGALSNDDQNVAGWKTFWDGLVLPIYTTSQINAIPTPPHGALVFNSTTNKIWVYVGDTAGWHIITSS